MRGTTTLRQTCRRGCFGAICVQRFDDSRNSAIHTTYRSSLRSSSLREPRYPLLRVVFGCAGGAAFLIEEHAQRPEKLQTVWCGCVLCVRRRRQSPKRPDKSSQTVDKMFGTDPSAGSPTETLLRLLLPLNDKVWTASRGISLANQSRCHSPGASPDHSIGRSDGRCVQRAGT